MKQGAAVFLIGIACACGAHADVLKKDGRIISIGYGSEEKGTIHFRLCTEDRDTSVDKPPYQLVKGDDCHASIQLIIPVWMNRLFGMKCEESDCEVVNRIMFNEALPALWGAKAVRLTRQDHVLTMSSGGNKAEVRY